MSAIVAATGPNRAYLMADAAVYNREGILVDIRSKTVLLPKLKAAGSCRGNLLPLAMFSTAVEDFTSWDDFRPNAPAVFAALNIFMAAVVPGRTYEFMLVGWSDERGRAEVIFHATHPRIPSNFNMGGPTLITETLIPRGPGLESLDDVAPAEFDPIAHGIPAFDQARATSCDLTCGEEETPIEGYSVGGFLQCVTITAAGIKSELLTEWPDQVGHKIRPDLEAVECLIA